jgi:hypothetical protein
VFALKRNGLRQTDRIDDVLIARPRLHERNYAELVLRFTRFIHQDAPVLAFPAKAGIYVWHGHRPSPVWQKL